MLSEVQSYPKRGADCEYTEDCMWGVDGWCDRPYANCILDKREPQQKTPATEDR